MLRSGTQDYFIIDRKLDRAHAMTSLALQMPLFRKGLRTAERMWRALTHELFDPYRPERHYMRGPGPKCRAKAIDSGR
jgi:hypothetical protein